MLRRLFFGGILFVADYRPMHHIPKELESLKKHREKSMRTDSGKCKKCCQLAERKKIKEKMKSIKEKGMEHEFIGISTAAEWSHFLVQIVLIIATNATGCTAYYFKRMVITGVGLGAM
ncbi:uncharacterized protein FN964_000996 isoform 1-T1 [Alca torda]